jgi:hypothetical protein
VVEGEATLLLPCVQEFCSEPGKRACLRRGLVFADCDPVANFALVAVTVTRDQEILRVAVRGLALLGFNHNRRYVRDMAIRLP